MSENYPDWLKVIYELLSDKTKMQKSVCNPILVNKAPQIYCIYPYMIL